MQLTWFGANSWLLEWQQQCILIDPWLVDDLVFGGQTWLFRGQRSQPLVTLPESIDLILLSQGLEDHAHRPTLARLNREVPVVASPGGAKVVRGLGYRRITTLTPGQTYDLGSLQIQAVPGAPIGLQQENGYLLRRRGDCTLYYEPHGFHTPELQSQGGVDVVIAPVVDLALPLVGSIIRGRISSVALAQQLCPQVWLPTAAGGEILYYGFLNTLLRTVGTVEDFRGQLAQHHLPTQVIEPLPGKPVALAQVAQTP
jgi:L-ascorbate metabolism protein UlaG (beta-lactamase superfamily)